MKKTLKILTVILAVVMICGLFAGCSCSTTEGQGLKVKATRVDGVYTGSYTVYGYNDIYRDGKAINYLDIGAEAKSMNITIDCIEGSAFAGNKNIQTLIVPSTVTHIKEGAFASIWYLKELTVPFIGEYAHADAFEDETAPAQYKAVDAGRTFSYFFLDTAFTTGVERTQTYDAKSTASTVNVYIPATLNKVHIAPSETYSIPMYAFCGISGIATIDITENVVGFGDSCFKNCTQLTTITISDVVELTVGNIENVNVLPGHTLAEYKVTGKIVAYSSYNEVLYGTVWLTNHSPKAE